MNWNCVLNIDISYWGLGTCGTTVSFSYPLNTLYGGRNEMNLTTNYVTMPQSICYLFPLLILNVSFVWAQSI